MPALVWNIQSSTGSMEASEQPFCVKIHIPAFRCLHRQPPNGHHPLPPSLHRSSNSRSRVGNSGGRWQQQKHHWSGGHGGGYRVLLCLRCYQQLHKSRNTDLYPGQFFVVTDRREGVPALWYGRTSSFRVQSMLHHGMHGTNSGPEQAAPWLCLTPIRRAGLALLSI
jgi:hypothetical protein